jgi:O-antigen/teichoic acid export membrane protein
MIHSPLKDIRGYIARLLPAQSLHERFARGVFWSLMGTGISQSLGLLASVATARMIGRVHYGEFGMINNTAGTFGLLAGFGLGLTATRYLAEFCLTDRDRAGSLLALCFWIATLTGCASALLLLLLADPIATGVLNAPGLAWDLRMASPLVLFNTISGVQTGSLAGFEAFRLIARVNAIRGLLNFPLMIAGAYWFGLRGVILASGIVAVAGFWLNSAVVKQECVRVGIPVGSTAWRSGLPVLWRFSIPVFLSNLVAGPALWWANAILAHQRDGYAELGLLNAANQWKTILTFLPVTLANAALPMFSSLHGGEEPLRGQRDSVEIVTAMNQLVLWPVALAVMFGSADILALYGSEFGQGRAILVLMIGGTAIGFIGNSIGTLILSKGFVWFGAALNLTWGAVLVFTTYVTAERYGGLSIAYGHTLGYGVILCGSTLYMLRRAQISKKLAFEVLAGGGVMMLLTAAALNVTVGLSRVLLFPMVVISIPTAALVFGGKDLCRKTWRRLVAVSRW